MRLGIRISESFLAQAKTITTANITDNKMTQETKPAAPNIITPGVDAINNALEAAGIHNQSINKSLDDIQKQTTSIAAANAGNAINGVLTGVATGITQINQGGTDNIVKGTLSLTTAVVSTSALVFGPAGVLVAGVFRGVASIVGSLLGIFGKKQQSLAKIISDLIQQAVDKVEKDGALKDIGGAKEEYYEAITYITQALDYDGEYTQAQASAIENDLNSMGVLTMFADKIGAVSTYVDNNWSDSKQYDNVSQVMFGYISMLSSKINLLMQAATLYQRIGNNEEAETHINMARPLSYKFAQDIKNYLPMPIYPALGVIAKMSESGYSQFQNTVSMAANLNGDLPYQPQQNGWYNIASLELDKDGKQVGEDGSIVDKIAKSVQSDTKFTLKEDGWHLRMTNKDEKHQGPFNIVQVNLDDTPPKSTHQYDKAVAAANGKPVHAILFIEHSGFLSAEDGGVRHNNSFTDHIWKRPLEPLWLFY